MCSIIKRFLRQCNFLHAKLATRRPKQKKTSELEVDNINMVTYQFSVSQEDGSAGESFFFCVDAAS